MMPSAMGQISKREEKDAELRSEAIKAWENYQKNGLHLTLEEADQWFAELESGDDVEPPACHT